MGFGVMCVYVPFHHADKGKVDVFKKTGTEIGKSAAAKSGGLFSAEDWHCSS